MTPLLHKALDVGLELNDRLAAAAANGFDWLFRRDQLVKSGQTDYAVIFQGDLMTVRHYELRGETSIELADGSRMPIRRTKHKTPLVLIPPLGVTTETFDLMPNRSLVRFMAAAGFDTYLIDWGKPSRRHATLGVKDYADVMMSKAVTEICAHSGAPQVSLMGWCMGGLIGLLHAGIRNDQTVRNIVTIASPIDMRSGGMVAGVAQAVNTPAKLIRKYTDFRLHKVDPKFMQAPSWATTLAFKLTDPIGSVTTYWDLLMNLWDREFVESHTTTSNYLNNMLVYPAAIVQDFLIQGAVDNKLALGEFRLGKRISRFANIDVPLLAFAGKTDVLVAPATARKIMELVASKDKQFIVAPGGHMGVILGSKAQNEVWADSAKWLATRSGNKLVKPVPSKHRRIAPPVVRASKR
jgi:polyhydroxyalkanoate synthase